MVLNSSPIRPSGVQLTSPMRPPGRHDARQLRGDDLVARRELDAEHRQHAVEALVVEGQVLGVALDPVDRDAVPRRRGGGGLEQLGREVEADDLRSGGGGRHGDVAGAGRDVEHVVARRERSRWASRSRGGTSSISSATAA